VGILHPPDEVNFNGGTTSADDKNTVAATSTKSLVEFLVISVLSESQGSFYLASHDRLLLRKRTAGRYRNL